MKKITTFLTAILLAGLLAGCISKAEHIYQLAADAVRQHPALPKNAVVMPMDPDKVFIGKSESTVIVGYTENGKNLSYTVFLKDLGKRWVVDTCEPTPDFSKAPLETPAPAATP